MNIDITWSPRGMAEFMAHNICRRFNINMDKGINKLIDCIVNVVNMRIDMKGGIMDRRKFRLAAVACLSLALEAQGKFLDDSKIKEYLGNDYKALRMYKLMASTQYRVGDETRLMNTVRKIAIQVDVDREDIIMHAYRLANKIYRNFRLRPFEAAFIACYFVFNLSGYVMKQHMFSDFKRHIEYVEIIG